MTMMTAPPAAANPSGNAVPGRYAGVDTHRDTHHVSVVDELGRAVVDRQFVATGAGYRQIVDFLRTHGPVLAVGVEGTGSYGAELARVLVGAGMTVIEVMRANRQHRRLRGKSDPLDAQQAALTVAAGRAAVVPKQRDGQVESLRILLAERTSATKARTAVLNQVHALLITAPGTVRTDFHRYRGQKLMDVLARTRPGPGDDPDQVARASLKRLAARHRVLTEEITVLDDQLEQIARRLNPALLATQGVGPVVAASLLATVGDNPHRIATRAQFAALCGVAPIPASSGKTNRHRLSRGGDRQANRALHRIVLIRMRFREPRTMAYFARRRAEGLADRDIIRCLKRHVANEVFALLTHPSTEPLPGPSLRRQRQALGIRLTDAAGTLGVPYQRLRRLELGIRTDPDLVHRCQHWLDETDHQRLKTA
ncbi:Transposase IS116/IS110/IS902 family [Kocuria rosea]|uniref:IS110 family transposase n=1 Tax=Kocuria rosea TaxID=1275 RepID=UPI000F7067E2|nr:IS110 family transposase [Kocuria rosea]VEH42550.1 Transposase IS116/IS110/IS902 family [Kocuria rosea]